MERAFGQLTKRFQLFDGVLPFSRPTCIKCILAALALHNFLNQKDDMDEDQEYEPDLIDYEARRERAPNPSTRAKIYRDRFVEYFDLNRM